MIVDSNGTTLLPVVWSIIKHTSLHHATQSLVAPGAEWLEPRTIGISVALRRARKKSCFIFLFYGARAHGKREARKANGKK